MCARVNGNLMLDQRDRLAGLVGKAEFRDSRGVLLKNREVIQHLLIR